jgi:hypothetical protein
MEGKACFLRKAEQCRRLAAHIPNQNDSTARKLRALAEEYEAGAQSRARNEEAGPETDDAE